jgi:hypothetical protein
MSTNHDAYRGSGRWEFEGYVAEDVRGAEVSLLS